MKTKCVIIAAYLIIFSSIVATAQSDTAFWNNKMLKIANSGGGQGFIRLKEDTKFTPNEFFITNKEAFRLSDNDEMILLRTKSDDLGYSHHLYQQKHNGVKIEGAEYILHEFNGRISTANGKLLINIEKQTNPSISKEVALQNALGVVNASKYAWEVKNPNGNYFSSYPEGELLFTKKHDSLPFDQNSFVLAYKFDIFSIEPYTRNYIYINAQTGNVLTEYENSLESAYNSGIVIVVSSGNYYHDSPIPISQVAYPASSQFTISVGASNESDNRADFSHYGSDLDIIAPGTNILTVYKKFINKYEKVNGTSFSAPIVSGISALILSQNPELNPEQVRDILIESADKVSGMNGQNFHVEYGFGRVNAKRALEFVPEIKYDITLNNEVITDLQIVNAQNSINASYYSVEPGATVIFKAGNSIDLTDEFNAKEGSNFYAYIDDVGVSCSSKSLKSEKAVDNDTIKKEEIASSEEHMNNNSIPTNVITSENPNIIVFPNPFSENATIQFEIRTNPQIVNIYINDLIGRTIKTIVKSNNNPNGKYSVDFNLSGFKQGIYFVILEIDQQKYARKIIYKQ